MEGPGGYQLVGRTVPVWSLSAAGPGFEPGVPWLLRSFDRLHFYPVGAEELLALRADLRAGRWGPDIEPGTLSFAAHRAFLDEHADAIEQTRAHRRAAFAAERRRWEARGELTELVS
jgi:urea carboxylase